MRTKISKLWPVVLVATLGGIPKAYGVSCTTQAQMEPAQRDGLVTAARGMLTQVQNGDLQSLRASTLPAIAADFSGIQQTVQYLEPLIQHATVTVDDVYLLDASTQAPNSPSTDFFCGSPVVGFNFNGLPPGIYAVTILHATGVPQPQQVSLILSKAQGVGAPQNHWLLAGFFEKPMVLAGHDGAWYWENARRYAQQKADWGAWFYYHIATYLLDPVDFLASQNLEKLRHETSDIHPNLPAANAPLMVSASGVMFKVTSVDTTTALGPLDLEVHYAPNSAQIAELRYPPIARKQVSDLMAGLLSEHPELRNAFHGMWLHADQGDASLFALELPMQASTAGAQPASGSAQRP